jgi:uncharacterized protein
VIFGSAGDKKFYSLLQGAAANIQETAHLFVEMCQNLDNGREYAIRLKELEKKGDRFTQELITLLNQMFVTPLERDQVLSLAVALDDVVDGVEATASRLDIYQITEADQHIRNFARILEAQAQEIAVAIDHLSRKQLLKVRDNNIQINSLENQGDEELRASLSHLFATEKDPFRLVKLKEIYETLEVATDRAEDVADHLESVVMKNA